METPLPANASAGLKELVNAHTALQKGAGNIEAEAKLVRSTLAAQLMATGAKASESKAVEYATVAARACLGARQPQLAGDLIALGLKFAPTNSELAYLARVLERETSSAAKPGVP